MVTDNPNIWWWISSQNIDKQWPCPDWYYIPNITDRNSTYNHWRDANIVNDNVWVKIGLDLNLPFGWYRKSYFDSEVGYQWEQWAYRLSTYDSENRSPISVHLKDNEIYTDTDWSVRGYLIRCFKDVQNLRLNIYPNWWTHAIISFTWNVGEWIITKLWEPIRDSGTFWGWYSDRNYKNQVHIWDTVPSNLYAKWSCGTWFIDDWEKCSEKKIDKSSNYSWGWKNVIHEEDIDENDVQDKNTKPKNDNYQELDIENYDANYSLEQNKAYQFSYQNWITTQSTIKDAKMYTPITRIQMAKMLSYFAMNVLNQVPDASRWIMNFKDVTNKMNNDYDNAVTLSYQLKIMWINMPNGEFRPNDHVTRAEFATALSRMLYSTPDWKYGWTSKYYINHMRKLVEKKIITNNDPNLQELRGYVMIMLMRSVPH